ncbi:hypothetical protein [Terrilactibacillus laevilacticus]|uniref:hypothetical protein n=1 Tax=Terrilactibacillus laevilacticus TaxID=1380157 RepID=UPI001146F3DA|nr:hypothetical protein [Terrilactibacillus laevilacticus]
MNNFKKIVFIIIAGVFVFAFGGSYIINTIKKSNPRVLNSAESITLSSGTYTVGKDVKPGFYDIESLNGKIHFSAYVLNKGDKVLNNELYDQSKINVEGKGKVKLSPSKVNAIHLNKGKYAIIHSGYYIVGKQIPKGSYTLSYSTKDKDNIDEKIFVQKLKELRGNPLNVYLFKHKNRYKINLENGNVIQVIKTLKDDQMDIIINLTPDKS